MHMKLLCQILVTSNILLQKKMMGNIYFLLDKYIYYGIRINKLYYQSCILDLIFIYLNYILNSLIKIPLN